MTTSAFASSLAPIPVRSLLPQAAPVPGPSVIPLHRPLWRRAIAALRQWRDERRERALMHQRCRELARLDAATLRDIGLGACAAPDARPDWVQLERARW